MNTENLIVRHEALCKRKDDLQYLAPPDERHLCEEVWEWRGERFHVFYDCSGTLLGGHREK